MFHDGFAESHSLSGEGKCFDDRPLHQFLEKFVEAGVDVLIGVDPHRWNIEEAKQRVGNSICLWGGVNGYLTVEMGSEEEVRAEVRRAMQVLAPGSGFILSPVDNVREDTKQSAKNVGVLIDEWQHLTK